MKIRYWNIWRTLGIKICICGSGHRELTDLIKLCVLNCCVITVEVDHKQVASAHG